MTWRDSENKQGFIFYWVERVILFLGPVTELRWSASGLVSAVMLGITSPNPGLQGLSQKLLGPQQHNRVWRPGWGRWTMLNSNRKGGCHVSNAVQWRSLFVSIHHYTTAVAVQRGQWLKSNEVECLWVFIIIPPCRTKNTFQIPHIMICHCFPVHKCPLLCMLETEVKANEPSFFRLN